FSPKKTLHITQPLYQKAVLSYPPSHSNYLTQPQPATFSHIFHNLTQFHHYKPFLPPPIHSIINNNPYLNHKNLTHHYPIIPTQQLTNPTKLSPHQNKIYHI
ncbi:DNA topoisomerase, partial [Bacillus mycoides]|uniref:DNA topoisomerase n=1 Tax=Bacillus mycoides TaxID=1405 RepID=UPI003CC7FF20